MGKATCHQDVKIQRGAWGNEARWWERISMTNVVKVDLSDKKLFHYGDRQMTMRVAASGYKTLSLSDRPTRQTSQKLVLKSREAV